VRETAFTPAAQIVPEASLKPSMSSVFQVVSQKVSTVASICKLSLQSFNDMPTLQQWLDMRLRADCMLKEENVFVAGDAANNVDGLLDLAPPFVYTPAATDTAADAIAKALGQLMTAGYRPDVIVMNGSDYTATQLLKTTVGSYVLLPTVTPPDDKGVWEGQPSLWGLPVVISPSMAAGTFLVGAAAAGAALFDRELLNVQLAFQNEGDFVNNLVCLRAEMRSALAVTVPQAFLQGTLPAGTTATAAPVHTSHPAGVKK
jgi:HK97 family phage major capsid protein